MLSLRIFGLIVLTFNLILHSSTATPGVLFVFQFIAYLITEGKGKKPQAKGWSQPVENK